jgi:hypothetical protein
MIPSWQSQSPFLKVEKVFVLPAAKLRWKFSLTLSNPCKIFYRQDTKEMQFGFVGVLLFCFWFL